MKWNSLENRTQVDEIITASHTIPQLVFKHSTRCGISADVLERFEKEYAYSEEKIVPYYLDLLAHREISNYIAERLEVTHQSPQVILIKDGLVVYHASHQSIKTARFTEYL